MTPVGVGVIGAGLSCLAFWVADTADDRRVVSELQSRAEWRARDMEAKIRLSGNAVENVAIAMAVNPAIGPDQFERIATRARRGLAHVNSLQWAPRVRRDGIAEFERSARARGLADYRVFEVTRDFRPTELSDRQEHFPVLYDKRFHNDRQVLGLSLGKFEGRGAPMLRALEEGRPVATLPVRPIGPPRPALIYLLFWPVYQGVEVPASVDDRRAAFRGYALGNYDVAGLLAAALRDTPEIVETIWFSVAASHRPDAIGSAAAVYSAATKTVEVEPSAAASSEMPAVRLVRHFEVFGQHWDLAFDYSPATVATLRSREAWGWLVAGLLLTAALVSYLLRERGRTATIESLVEERTADLKRASEQLHQAQKMESIGNMTGGMAHDFNNLLAVVVGNLDLLQDRLENDPASMSLVETALQASTRGAELTRQLLAFARRQPLTPSITDVNELVIGMTRLLERILEKDIEITLVTAPNVWPVLIDPAQLGSAIANLATNARDAMPDGGRLTIETRNTHLDADYAADNPESVPGDYVLLEVSDTGTGIPAETLKKVFEPFFTTKQPGQGTGLGLSMVFGFVKQSQGHIKIYSEVGQGTTIRIYLPRAEREKRVAAMPAEAPARPHEGHETILLVEDNEDVRSTVAAQLTGLGYAVIEAESARAALASLRDPHLAIDLLFTDLVMPGGMNGHELARAAAAERPGLKVLFTSGYSGRSLRDDDRLKVGEHFLSKPYRRSDLARKLKEVFGQ